MLLFCAFSVACHSKLTGKLVSMRGPNQTATTQDPDSTSIKSDEESSVVREETAVTVAPATIVVVAAEIPRMSLADPEIWANEDTKLLNFTITFEGPTLEEFDLPIVLSGNFTAADKSVTKIHIPANVISYTAKIPIADDQIPGNLATLEITLQPTQANRIIGTSRQVFKIVDNDPLPISGPALAFPSASPGPSTQQLSPDGSLILKYNGKKHVLTSSLNGNELFDLYQGLPAHTTIVGFTKDSNWILATAYSLAGAGGIYFIPRNGGIVKNALDFKTTTHCTSFGAVREFASLNKVAYFCTAPTRAIYSASLDGSGPTNLTGTFAVANSYPNSFEFSPDGSRLAYTANRDIANVNELFLVNADGTEHRKVHNSLVSGMEARDFSFSLNSQKLLYISDEDDTTREDLFVINTDYATPNKIKLNQNQLAVGTTIAKFKVSEDTSHVVYKLRPDGSPNPSLYSNSIAGSSEVTISNTSFYVSDFEITADSGSIIFLQYYGFMNQYNLFSAPILGGSRTMISVAAAPATQNSVANFKATRTGNRVVYASREEDGSKLELFAVDVNGSNRLKLSHAVSPTFTDVESYLLSPDNLSAVFTADKNLDGQIEIFSTAIAGGSINSLNAVPTTVFGDVYSLGITISPNSSQVFYQADLSVNELWDFYHVNMDGTQLLKASPVYPLPYEKLNHFGHLSVTSDQKYLLFESAGYDLYGTLNYVYAYNLGTAQRARITPESDVSSYDHYLKYLPTQNKIILSSESYSSTFLWTSDPDGSNRVDLFKTGTYGSSYPKYSCASASPDGNYIAYAGYLDGFTNTADIYLVDTSGLNNHKVTSGFSFGRSGVFSNWMSCKDSFKFAADNSKMLFFGDYDAVWQFELWSANLDGSGRIRLSQDVNDNNRKVEQLFGTTPDSSSAVFYGDTVINDQWHLYSVSPVGGVIHQISDVAGLSSRTGYSGVKFTSDSQTVIYPMTQGPLEQLYSNSLLGGRQVALSRLVLAGSKVSYFEILNNQTVLYCADEEILNEFEIYSINIDGTQRRKLSSGAVAASSQFTFNDTRTKILALTRDNLHGTTANLYEIDIVSGQAVRINHDNLFAADAYILSAAYVPDSLGRKIIFTVYDSHESPTYSVYLADTSTGKQVRVTSLANPYDFRLTKDIIFHAAPDGSLGSVRLPF
jgi:hypothetical protein